MALDLTTEHKELGKGNFNAATGDLTRRGFMKSMAIGAAGLAPVAAGTYFGYEAMKGKPVKAALIGCMRAGKHVLCEKLMARTVSQCKEMIKVAKETNRILSIGHQRHYSMLYAHATELIQAGMLGDVNHIRALWHRNFSWPWSPPT